MGAIAPGADSSSETEDGGEDGRTCGGENGNGGNVKGIGRDEEARYACLRQLIACLVSPWRDRFVLYPLYPLHLLIHHRPSDLQTMGRLGGPGVSVGRLGFGFGAEPCAQCGRSYPHEHVRALRAGAAGYAGRGNVSSDDDR